MKKYLLLAFFMLSTTFYASNETEPSKLDDVLATVVEKGLALAEKTGTFVIEQAPELIQEFYQWHLYENIFYISIGVLIIILGWVLSFKSAKYINKNDFFDSPPPAVIFLIGVFGGLAILSTNLYDLIFLYTAPKLYLIEYFIR